MKPAAIGRKRTLVAGSKRARNAEAIAFTLIKTAKRNDVDPQAWPTRALAQITDHKITRLKELFPCATLPSQRNQSVCHRPGAGPPDG